jgi:hypothetical protein
VPEEHVTRETLFRHRLRLDTYKHYPPSWEQQSWASLAEHALIKAVFAAALAL